MIWLYAVWYRYFQSVFYTRISTQRSKALIAFPDDDDNNNKEKKKKMKKETSNCENHKQERAEKLSDNNVNVTLLEQTHIFARLDRRQAGR